MNLRILSLLILLSPLSTPVKADGQYTASSKRIGDLLVRLVGAQRREPAKNSSNHYLFAVRLSAKNVGKQALCVSFNPTLKATFGLEYWGTSSENPLIIREMLPGENAEGEYLFSIKNDVEPLELVLKPYSESQTCTRGKDSLSAIWHNSTELRFELTGVSNSSSQEDNVQIARIGEFDNLRVFLTDKKSGTPKDKVVKTFFDSCPQARITADRDKAGYVVELAPASMKQSKNTVRVTSKSEDVIYSGETFNLGNAAKDACIAILKDFGSRPRTADPR